MTTRRAVLAAGTALTVAACAACTGRTAAPSTTVTPPAGTPPGTLARLDDLEVGVPVAVTAGDVPLLLVRTGDTTVAAFSAVCPHQGCTVLPEGEAFACPCHGSQFAADGAVTAGPARAGLVPVPVAVTDGAVSLA